MDREESPDKFESYLRRRFPERRTSKDYVSDLRQFMAVCAKPWREVKMQDIDNFVDQQRQSGLKPATVKRRVAALKTFFDFQAEESGDLSWPNPVRMKRHAGKQGHRLPRDLSDEMVERLWHSITSVRDRAWFALLLRAGLRVGEAVGLKLDDVLSPASESQPARLRVCGKGRKERLVLLTADAYAVLQAWLLMRPVVSSTYVFLNERDGGPLSANGIEYCLREYGKQAGVSVTPHQLRHTYARQLTEAGMPITSLGKLLGHSQVSTTQIYTAGADPQLAQAYQQAMQRLASAPLPLQEAPSTLPPAAPLLPFQERPDVSVDWEAWGLELPPAIREATLAFVKRRQPLWKPGKRGKRAKVILGEFHRFWSRQMKLRPIQHPTELTLQDFHNFQTLRSTEETVAHTVDYTISLVIELLRQLADQGMSINHTIFRFRPRSRPESLPRHLQEDEAQRLDQFMLERLASSDEQVRLENACCFVLAHTGLRASECLELCVQDLDLPGKRLFVREGKGRKDRVVYLSDTACQALQQYMSTASRPAHALLFTFPDGRPVSYMWLYQHLLAIGQVIQIPSLTAHRLRHTLATRLLNTGMEITRIQKILGHEHVNTTTIYARIHDQTVETEYRQAMKKIERQQMPLSNVPLLAEDWLMKANINPQVKTLDNSV
jgi:integrase/recombinase XerC